MDSFFVYISVILIVIISIPLYRIYLGPTLYDRILGASAIGTKTLVLIVLIGCVYGRLEMFLDITLAYAVLNFIGVLAIAKYLNSARGRHG